VPTVPEVSLIFDPRPKTQEDKHGNTTGRLPSTRLTVRPSDDTAETSSSPVWNDRNSYAHWKEQNYHRVGSPTNTTRDSLSYGNIREHDYGHVPQERDKSRDRQRRPINRPRTNDRTSEKSVKFQYPIPIGCDPHSLEQRTRSSPSDGRMSRTSLQRTAHSVIDRCDNVIPDRVPEQNGHSQMYPYGGCRPQYCLPGYSNYGVDNNETVKTLLQLVNSQSEQIRNLQLQIDRLVRMQEENFRNRSACRCHSPSLVANQAYGYPPMNYYDATVGSSVARCSSQDTKDHQNIGPPQLVRTSAVGKEGPITTISDESDKLETASTMEQQSKKTSFMEQKVSIGVMTSFEFTVQNSPFLMEPETYNERKEAPPKEDKDARNINVSVHDASDSAASKRYKNTFARGKPGAAQLENIVEDSESHLSSSQQQSSSNFNTSSVRDSERHTPRQSDLYNATSTLESSRMYQHPPVDFNLREKAHEEMYTGRDDNADERPRNVRGTSDASANVDYSCSGSANYSKAPVVGDTDGYTALDEEESNDKITGDAHSANCALGSPARHRYQGRKTQERHINAKETTKDVGDSVVLSGGDLRIERPPPTPEPSIHVEMQEYTSDDESDRPKRTSKIGWTFYNNVLGQVNDILQSSSMINDKDECNAKVARKVEQESEGTETKRTKALDTVKAATLEQLRKLGISLTENSEHRESNGNNKT